MASGLGTRMPPSSRAPARSAWRAPIAPTGTGRHGRIAILVRAPEPPASTFEPTPQTCRCWRTGARRSERSSSRSASGSGSRQRTHSEHRPGPQGCLSALRSLWKPLSVSEGEKRKARMRWRWNRRRHQVDQAASAADQTAADADQTASDTDQGASDHDQARSDADQRSSERDQAAADRDLASRLAVDPQTRQSYELSRSERAQGTLDRRAGTLMRAQVSLERDAQAKQRDEVAGERDRVAEERDRVAEDHDREIKRKGEERESSDPRARRALEALAEMRDRSAANRMRAAADRARAAKDRDVTALDRKHLLGELQQAHLDAPTGAYQRGMGEVALVNEIERARRTKRALSLAYIDLDARRKVNDLDGHGEGDELLRELVALLRSLLRPYDPVVRWGGDEFVCTISDATLGDATRRFEGIRADLAEAHGEGVTVGLATLEEKDSLETLLERADTALLEARQGS